MAVDVVVVNYHNDDLLHGFLRSFGDHCAPKDTLTIVDVGIEDHEGDGEWEGVSYHYIGAQENIGYARACNKGAKKGANDVILLANADTVLSDFKECHDVLLSHDDWGVLGPRQVDENNRITAGGIVGDDRSPMQRGWQENDAGQYSDVREDVLSVSGSLYFIKRKLWQELTDCSLYQEVVPGAEGAFLPTQHYFEEMFCSLHARAHGYKCVYYGPVQMVHYWHKASPHGGWQDMEFFRSQQMHRQACAYHGILCE